MPFRLSPQEATKKTQISAESLNRSAESSFDKCADVFLPTFDFVVKTLKKTALDFGEKLPNSLVFQEKIVTWRSCSRQIKKAIWQSSDVVCKSPEKNRQKF